MKKVCSNIEGGRSLFSRKDRARELNEKMNTVTFCGVSLSRNR